VSVSMHNAVIIVHQTFASWEPTESFTRGSQHFITAFWNKAELDGRDRNDAESFKLHETVYPSGQPGMLS
jgi:hypothetical protein